MLNLDLLEQLNKQSQWQHSKITRSPKIAHPLQSYFLPTSPRLLHARKQRFPFRDYIPVNESTQDLNGFTTRNHSTSNTKRTAQGLIQRYKACYS